MDMKAFSDENVARCTAKNGFNHPLDSWSLSDWMVATMGELGEAANVLKKLNRVRDGIPGNSETPEQLKQMFADELADTYIYLDLMCRAAGRECPWFGILRHVVADRPSIYMTEAVRCLGVLAETILDNKPLRRGDVENVSICLEALAMQSDVDLQAAIRAKFDRTSAKIGYVP